MKDAPSRSSYVFFYSRVLSGLLMAKKGVDWFPIYDEDADIASLAADGELTMIDVEIENRGTGVAYGSGAVVGLRMWSYVGPESDLASEGLVLHAMILPAGLAVPSVKSPTLMKRAEKFYWFTLPLRANGVQAAGVVYVGEVHIKTARRFDQGDRLVVVVHNLSSGSLGAGAESETTIDAYVRED